MKKKHSFLTKNIIIASDHAGFELKELIKKKLENLGLNILDLGVDNKKVSVDYPTYAKKLSKKINSKNMGILICGSGIGMSIASNRFKNVRSAVINSSKLSKLSRKHNNANIIWDMLLNICSIHFHPEFARICSPGSTWLIP